jgi:hypothetical protein
VLPERVVAISWSWRCPPRLFDGLSSQSVQHGVEALDCHCVAQRHSRSQRRLTKRSLLPF